MEDLGMRMRPWGGRNTGAGELEAFRLPELPLPLGVRPEGEPRCAEADWLDRRLTVWNRLVAAEGWCVVAPIDEAAARPGLRKGMAALESGAEVVVAMSLDNSYFSRDTLTRLFRLLASFDVKVRTALMDATAAHNYQALGYDQAEAERRARTRGQRLKNMVARCVEDLGAPDKHRFQELGWDRIRGHAAFHASCRRVWELYTDNSALAADVRAHINAYLVPKLNGPLTPEILAHAEHHPIEELALALASPEIIGAERVAYLYHHPWPTFEQMIAGGYGAPPIDNLGFLQLEVKSTD